MPPNLMQDLRARIEKLREHVKTRRGRRDGQAFKTLIACEKLLKQRTVDSGIYDQLMKNYYTDELCRPDRMYLLEENPALKFLKKEPRVGVIYVQPVVFPKDDE